MNYTCCNDVNCELCEGTGEVLERFRRVDWVYNDDTKAYRAIINGYRCAVRKNYGSTDVWWCIGKDGNITTGYACDVLTAKRTVEDMARGNWVGDDWT